MENQNSREEIKNTTEQNFFLPEDVKKCRVLSIRTRIDVILIERGLKWADVYNALRWSRSFASLVHNGKLIPPNWQRVALAKQMGVDTSVIWDIPEIQPVDNLQNNLEAIK